VGTPGRPADFSLIEHHVDDLAGATRLFSEILGGQVDSSRPGPGAAALTWPGGVRLRLTEVPAIPPAAARTGGGLARLCFSRPGLPFGPQEQNRQQELARRLGISVLLTS
jgi:hypothetical protein